MHTIPPSEDTVTATYLHIPSVERFRPAVLDDPELLLLEAQEPLPEFYRFLYTSVGRQYRWTDRLSWSDTELQAYLSRPEITLLVLYTRGTPAGYIELASVSDEPGTEIRYFGIIPAFQGHGMGKHLLSLGVYRGFRDGAVRVWLSTRSSDGPYALANYKARGFVEYKVEREPAPPPYPSATR